MQGTTFICSHCTCRVEHDNIPIALYLVAGAAPLHPQSLGTEEKVEVTDIPMPEVLRRLFSEGGKWEFCLACFAKVFGVPLVDKEGTVVASPDQAKAHLKSWAPPPKPTPPQVPVNEEARLREENAQLKALLDQHTAKE